MELEVKLLNNESVSIPQYFIVLIYSPLNPVRSSIIEQIKGQPYTCLQLRNLFLITVKNSLRNLLHNAATDHAWKERGGFDGHSLAHRDCCYFRQWDGKFSSLKNLFILTSLSISSHSYHYRVCPWNQTCLKILKQVVFSLLMLKSEKKSIEGAFVANKDWENI